MSGPEKSAEKGAGRDPAGFLSALESELRRAFAPDALEVVDESGLHRGHSGWRAGAVTHVRIAMTSERFCGRDRVARARMVHEALSEFLGDGGLHALSLRLAAAGESRKGRADGEP